MSIRQSVYATDGAAAVLRSRGPAVRLPAARSAIALAALAGLVAATAVISVAAARTGGLLPETTRPVPSWLAGPLGGTGASLGNPALILTLVACFACYIAAMAAAGGISVRSLIAAVVAMHLLVLLAPPLFSTDMFGYQVYARMGVLHHVNPYLAGPHAVSYDPLYRYMGYRWTGTPTVYGPLFTVLSYAAASVSIAASVWAFKAVAAGASLLTLLLVWKLARARGIDPVRAVAIVGLNPLLVIYGVGGGHNDLLMLMLMVGGICLALQGRPAPGGATMVCAAAIKLAGGLPLLFALAAPGRAGARRSPRTLLGAGAAAGGIALLGFGIFGRGMLRLPSTVEQVQSKGDWHSFAGFLVKSLHLAGLHQVISIGLSALCLLVWAWLIAHVWRGQMDWIRAAGWAAVALLLTASSLLPWYIVWLLPLAALGGDRRLQVTTVVLTGAMLTTSLIDYLPHSSFVWHL